MSKRFLAALARWSGAALLGAVLAAEAAGATSAPYMWPDAAASGGSLQPLLDGPGPPAADTLPPQAPGPDAPVGELLFTYAYPPLTDDERRRFIDERGAIDPRAIEINYPLVDRIVRDLGSLWIETPAGELVRFVVSRPCRARFALTSCSAWSADGQDLLTFGVSADRQTAYITLYRDANYRTARSDDGRLVLYRVDWGRTPRPH